MAYNQTNKNKQIAFVMAIYNEWKERKSDIPDTFFVKNILPKHGFFMSYSSFIKKYKHNKSVSISTGTT